MKAPFVIIRRAKPATLDTIPRHITLLLLGVGVPRSIAYAPRLDTSRRLLARARQRKCCGKSNSFWDRPDVADVLALAAQTRLRMVKKLHPDKGGSTAAMAYLNGFWERLLRSARRRGFEYLW